MLILQESIKKKTLYPFTRSIENPPNSCWTIKAEYFNKDTHNTVLYFLDYGQDKEKQNDFNNVTSFRGTVISTCQLYKPLAKDTRAVSIPIDFRWEYRRQFADHSGRQFCKLGFVYFHEIKTCGTVLTFQWQRM